MKSTGKNLFTTTVLSSSLILALVTLSSCGKSKEVKSNPPVTATPASPTLESNSPNSPAPSQPQTPAAPQTPPRAPGDNSLPDNGATVTPAQPQRPDARGGRQGTPNTGSSEQDSLISDSRSSTKTKVKKSPAEINFSGVQAVKTGGVVKGKAEEPEMFFTGTGNDGLTEEFKSYNSKVSAEQQNMNINLAKAVVNAKLVRPSVSSVGSLTLTIDEFGTLKTYRLITSADGEKLKLTKSSNGTTGEMEFQGGFVKCLDVSGQCHSAYAKIKMAGGYLRVIFRNTEASVHYLIQENIIGNGAFDILKDYVLNAANAVATSKRIERMRLSSFEVINGRAAMGALLTTEDREAIQLSVPMVVSGFDSDVLAKATKTSDLSKSFDLPNMAGTHSQNLIKLISEVNLVKNNGRGEFKLQMQMGTTGSPASIWAVVMADPEETISLEKVRLFESKVKAF